MRKTLTPVKPIQNTSDLRRLLIETIGEVRKGKMEPRQADSISRLSGTILKSAMIDLDYLKFEAASTKQEKRTLNLTSGTPSMVKV